MTLGESHRLAQLGWLKTLIAPLLGLSVVLHGALLVAPVPSRPLAEVEEEETAEEEFVDLLSISSLAAPDPEPEPELPNTPPPEATPPQTPAAAPTAPTQPVIPEVYPDTPPPEPSLADAAPLAAEPLAAAPVEPAVPFVQEEEVVEIFTRLTRGAGDSDFDSTETSFPAIAYLTRQGISEWSPAEQTCFFTQINADDYRLQPQAASLRYLTRNVQFIENQDIPRTFPAPQYQVSRLPEGYCNRPFFQVLRAGQPYLFVSLVGIGVGATGQQASGLVVIWSSDPRGG
jgi:hypothetical protein